MEITPGVRRCSFGYGEVDLTQEQVDGLNTDQALAGLGRTIADIQWECTSGVNIYQCKCQLADLIDAVRAKRKALGNKENIKTTPR